MYFDLKITSTNDLCKKMLCDEIEDFFAMLVSLMLGKIGELKNIFVSILTLRYTDVIKRRYSLNERPWQRAFAV